MIQHPGGGPSFELLLLQDALKVLHPLLQVPHVSGQVTVEEAHGVSENGHPCANATFVPLQRAHRTDTSGIAGKATTQLL